MFEITLITSITKRIFPIGRLDKASEGLIFMTNDGDIVNKIRARNNHEKNIR
jgi:23S rRNA pseudouridine2604 synthase